MQLATDSTTNCHVAATVAATLDLSISSIGVVAEQQLNGVRQAQVLAVFERSFYVKTETGLFCVGLPEIGCGPLNALLASKQQCLPVNIVSGEHLLISNQKILLADGHEIDASQASVYHSENSFATPPTDTLIQNRQDIKSLQGMPEEGFFWLLDKHKLCTQESAVQSALRLSSIESLSGLVDWLQTGFADVNAACDKSHDASAALGLVGAGPGLTPAGDDVIAGVMLALARFQRTDLVNSIWQSIAPGLPILTNSISAAHLEQAAKGYCGKPMNDLLYEIFQAQKIEVDTLGAVLNSMGCTSGWDTLGGVMIVVDAWQHNLNTIHRTVPTC
jgi:hypothetical protein